MKMVHQVLNNFYVYKHTRLDNYETFYIGKGKGNRAYSKQRNKYWHNIVEKVGYKVHIVKSGLSDQEACQLEIKLISLFKKYGRCKANILAGGQSNSGVNNPMYRQGHKLRGSKNGMYNKVGKMKGRFGEDHPKYGIIESKLTRKLKSQAHLGEKHFKHKWVYFTPKGKFNSVTIAACQNGVTVSMVKQRCMSKNFKNWYKELYNVET
jgi:hypothetical protein